MRGRPLDSSMSPSNSAALSRGLAVLVSAFGVFTSHVQLGTRRFIGAPTSPMRTRSVHGMDDVFALGALFSLAALAMVAFGVRPVRQSAEAPVVLASIIRPTSGATTPTWSTRWRVADGLMTAPGA